MSGDTHKKNWIKALIKWGVGVTLLAVAAFCSWHFLLDHRPHVYTNDAFLDGFRSDLSPDILGRVVELNFDEGELVKKGQVVAVLLQDILKSEQAEAQASIQVMEDEIARSYAHLKKVKNDYIRAVKGIEDKIISYQDFDHNMLKIFLLNLF